MQKSVDNFQVLTTVPSSDLNFKAALEDALLETLDDALQVRGLTHSKTAYSAILKEIKRRYAESDSDSSDLPSFEDFVAKRKEEDETILQARRAVDAGTAGIISAEIAKRRLSAELLASYQPQPLATIDGKVTIVPNVPSSETQDKAMGEQLTAQYQKAVGGMRDVVLFGAMMIRLSDTFSARGKGSGNGVKGDGIKGWLSKYAPSVHLSTAYRFMAVAEAVASEFKLPKKIEATLGFSGLLTTPADQLPEAARAKQLELFEFVDGTSQRSWLDKLRPKNQGGGSREKKDVPPPTPEEALAKLTNDTRAWVDDVFTGPLKAKHWRLLEDTENLALASYFEEQAKALREWLKVPQRDRSAIALEDLH